MVDNAHAEGFGALGDRLADSAVAEYAHGLAAHFARERQRALEPAAGAHESVTETDAANRCNGQAHGKVGDAFVQHFRRVRDDQAALPGRFQIDAIYADAKTRDDFKLGQGVH